MLENIPTQRLLRCYRVYPNDQISNSEMLKFKSKFRNNTNAARNADVEIVVPLKHLSSFAELLTCHKQCEINLIQTWWEIVLFLIEQLQHHL